MWKLKSCPRCGGDIFRYLNVYNGWREKCFRCGHHTRVEVMFEEESMNEDSLRRAEGSTPVGK